MENCEICNSIINEITIFNGETKNFCSIECVNTEELIIFFKDFVEWQINKYKYIGKKELKMFSNYKINNNLIEGLTREVIKRGYFKDGRDGFLYSNNKIVRIGLIE